jgi:hypothetical protein
VPLRSLIRHRHRWDALLLRRRGCFKNKSDTDGKQKQEGGSARAGEEDYLQLVFSWNYKQLKENTPAYSAFSTPVLLYSATAFRSASNSEHPSLLKMRGLSSVMCSSPERTPCNVPINRSGKTSRPMRQIASRSDGFSSMPSTSISL